MSKKKVIISACLLGENCRYDGKTKQNNQVLETFKDYEIIPFCPEAPLFGTPRERISIINIDGKNRVITDNTNVDITKLLEDEIHSFITLNPNVQRVVLKSKSPSCGIGTTPMLNNNRELIGYTNGIAADIFLSKYLDIDIGDESINCL